MGRGGGPEGVLRRLRPVEAARIIVFLAHGKVELIFGSCKSLRGEQWPFVFVDCQFFWPQTSSKRTWGKCPLAKPAKQVHHAQRFFLVHCTIFCFVVSISHSSWLHSFIGKYFLALISWTMDDLQIILRRFGC